MRTYKLDYRFKGQHYKISTKNFDIYITERGNDEPLVKFVRTNQEAILEKKNSMERLIAKGFLSYEDE